MFYYIDHTCISSFPNGLVNTKSDVILRSVESGLGKWMLGEAVISVDAYPFLAFSDLTCHLPDTRIGVFWLHCAAWWQGDQTWKYWPKAGNHNGVVLVLGCAQKCVPTVISSGVDISEVPSCYLLRQMNSQCGSQK